MTNYKYTIVIPHHNIPNLLQRCLDSIPLRDDIQVVVVDDNSSSDKVDFANFPGEDRKNTTVILTKDGRGAGYARNIGLNKALGEWVIFADADDVFTEDFAKALMTLENNDADLVYFKVESRDSESGEILNEAFYQNELVEKFLKGDEMSLKFHHEVPWGKAVKRKMIKENNIRFDELMCGNDSLFAIKCDYYSKKTVAYPIVTYCWMRRKGSLWRNVNDNWYRTRFVSRVHIYQFLYSNGIVSEWSDERLIWYLQMIQYKSSFEYIKYQWIYGLTTHRYNILFKSVIDMLRVNIGSILRKLRIK